MQAQAMAPELAHQLEELAAGPYGQALKSLLKVQLSVELRTLAFAPSDQLQVRQGRVQAYAELVDVLEGAAVAFVMRSNQPRSAQR